MNIHSVSIRPLPPEEFEAFRSSDLVTSSSPSASARELAAVPIPGYSWMRLERSLEGGVTCFCVRIDSLSSSGRGSEEEGGSNGSLESGLRTLTLPEGVSVTQVYTGDYGQNGSQDMILRLSDGVYLLIEPQEEFIERMVPEEDEEPVDPYDPEPYDPEPAPSTGSVQSPASPPPAPPAPIGGAQTEYPRTISPSAKQGI